MTLLSNSTLRFLLRLAVIGGACAFFVLVFKFAHYVAVGSPNLATFIAVMAAVTTGNVVVQFHALDRILRATTPAIYEQKRLSIERIFLLTGLNIVFAISTLLLLCFMGAVSCRILLHHSSG